mgnify:FL=1|jgi:hypothetical protein
MKFLIVTHLIGFIVCYLVTIIANIHIKPLINEWYDLFN